MAGGMLKPLFTWRSAIAESDLPPTTRHVAVALSLYMSERGDSAHPGPTRLAQDTGLHVSTVKEKLADLERLGWVRCIHRGGRRGEQRRANEYVAAFPDPPLFDDPNSTAPVAPDDPSPSGTGRRGRGDPSSSPRLPVAHGDPISSENSSENSPSTRAAIDIDFERWWERYPRKIDKATARKRYITRRHQGVTHEQLVTARDNYAATVVDVEQRLIKHAATFLHGADGPWSEWLDGAPEGAAATRSDPRAATRALIEAGRL